MIAGRTVGENVKQASNLAKMQNPRTIDVLIFKDVNILDVAGPVQAFEVGKKTCV